MGKPKQTRKKVGEFGSISIISRSDSPVYSVYYKGSFKSTGEKTLKGAKAFAERMHNEIISQKQGNTFEPIPYNKAMEQAIARSKSKNNDHRLNLAQNAGYFCDFLAEAYPDIKYWHEITPVHAEEYVDTLVARNLACKTKKHYVGVITMTARYWHNVLPKVYHDFRVNHPGLVCDDEPVKNFASIEAVRFLIKLADVLGERQAKVCYALGGLAGLNLLEMVRKVEDFNFDANTINITKSKNKHRDRLIPLAGEVMDIVREYISGMSPSDLLFTRCGNLPAADYTINKPMDRVFEDCLLMIDALPPEKIKPSRKKRLIEKLGNQAESLLQEAKQHREQIKVIAPKDLRKSFMNAADEFDVNDRWLQAYVGHAAKSIIDKNYRSQQKFDKMRKHVLVPMFGEHEAGMSIAPLQSV